MLTARSTAPDPLLQPFIHWYVERETALGNGEIIEPVLPRAGAMLEFQFAAVYEVKAIGAEQLRPSWAVTVIGPIDAHRVRLVMRDRVQSLVVLFRPMGLYRLFGVPVAPLTGAGTEGHAVMGPQVSALYERLGNAASLAGRAKLLNQFFLSRLNQSRPLHPADRAMRLLASGRCNVTTAADMAGISERQLERRTLAAAGIAPKALARISRFQRAIQQYQSGHGNWLQIAHDTGYYDQMHLIRDFHHFGGGAPGEVVNTLADSHLISFCCR